VWMRVESRSRLLVDDDDNDDLDICMYSVSCIVKPTQTRTCLQTLKTLRLQVNHSL